MFSKSFIPISCKVMCWLSTLYCNVVFKISKNPREPPQVLISVEPRMYNEGGDLKLHVCLVLRKSLILE